MLIPQFQVLVLKLLSCVFNKQLRDSISAKAKCMWVAATAAAGPVAERRNGAESHKNKWGGARPASQAPRKTAYLRQGGKTSEAALVLALGTRSGVAPGVQLETLLLLLLLLLQTLQSL